VRRLFVLAIVIALGVFAFQRRSQSPDAIPTGAHEAPRDADFAVEPAPERAPASADPETGPFRCDGRTHCSQMTSCEEAYYFLEHCPGVKMDGDRGGRGDGVPCERQWCGSR
jgi:hypothetical protein